MASSFGKGIISGLVLGFGCGLSFASFYLQTKNMVNHQRDFAVEAPAAAAEGRTRHLKEHQENHNDNIPPLSEESIAALVKDRISEALDSKFPGASKLNDGDNDKNLASLVKEALAKIDIPTANDIAAVVAAKLEKQISSAFLKTTTTEASSSKPKPQDVPSGLTNAVASAFFTVDPTTGLIRFPKNITQVIIDVGARQSDYLSQQVQVDDKQTALILFDPLPDSYIPVANTASTFQMRNGGKWLDPNYMTAVTAVRAALGETEGIASFNVGLGPACGSILEFSKGDTPHWCMKSQQKMQVLILKLSSIIDMIPTTIRDIHIKIDAEGADLQVLKGGGDSLKRAGTVIIECSIYQSRSEIPTGSFNCSDAVDYMATKDFEEFNPPGRGHGENLFWIRKDWSPPPTGLSNFFWGNRLIFKSFYEHIRNTMK